MGLPLRAWLLLSLVCAVCGAWTGCRTPPVPSSQPTATALSPKPAATAPTVQPDSMAPDSVKTHALAFGAILDSQNGAPHSRLLAPMAPDEREEFVKRQKELLGSWWDVHSREELLDMLDNLERGKYGQRQAYWETRRKLVEAKMENYLRVIKEAEFESEGGARAFIVATHLGVVHGATLPIAAWDFGRYINLCRWGVVCGWITEQEAWDRIIPAARLLQSSYTSWDNFAADYLLGRNFWSPQDAADNETIRYRITLLKQPPKGLWASIDWNQSLGAGPVLKDKLAAIVLDHYQDPDPNAVSFDHVPNQNPLLIMVRTSVDSK
jgi:hypothetical protein